MPRQPPSFTVVTDADALAKTAAERVLARLDPAAGPLAVCLTGGSTPERLYTLLTQEPYRARVPWADIHWFWGDDRFVPPGDDRSNAGMARRLLLDRAPVPASHIHAIPTDTKTPQEAARRYEAELHRFYAADRFNPRRPLFAIVLMGVGGDGHTASLFPGHAEVDETQRWVVGVDEAGLEPFVPRVSLTLPTLASTREMLFMVSGKGKREVLQRVRTGADLPCTRAQADGDTVWLVDRAAAPEHPDAA